MSFGFFTCLWLVSFGVFLNISYGQLPLDSDTIPRTSRDVAASFQRFTAYNTAAATDVSAADQTLRRSRRRRKRTDRSYFLPFFKRPSDLDDRPNFFFDDDQDDDNNDDDSWKRNYQFPFHDPFQRTKFTPWTYVLPPPRSSLPKNDYKILPFPDPPLTPDRTQFHPRPPPPPSIDIPYLRDKFSSRRSFYRHPPPSPPPPLSPSSSLDGPTRNADRPEFARFFQNDIMSNDRRVMESADTTDDRILRSFAQVPEFTYYFDNDNSDLREKYPFAVRPNDPRYYRGGLSPVDTDDPSRYTQQIDRSSSNLNLLSKLDYDNLFVRDSTTESTERFVRLPVIDNPDLRNVSDVGRLRETEIDDENSPRDRPFVFSIARDLNSDIYFIAVIAGCSAAAMFVFVLISLTWCRLQRGAKAAADVEYPAYGVTGPNKDVSPSEDQRLAQSAQMYHFQHQKQQIIAMENRTSANRDPGSLSEAESDEENEEGDYTVYECPGLAATGEMEVKNPLFHDDPTPATPTPRVDKEEEDRM